MCITLKRLSVLEQCKALWNWAELLGNGKVISAAPSWDLGTLWLTPQLLVGASRKAVW